MSRDCKITESRLHAALERLLQNNPTKVKTSGKLTPNKINNEAGLGNSYIHKFPEFMAYAKPLIDDYNEKRENQSPEEQVLVSNDLSEIDKLRHEREREKRLKIKYKQERDDAVNAKKELEVKCNKVMYRLFELQEETLHKRCAVIRVPKTD